MAGTKPEVFDFHPTTYPHQGVRVGIKIYTQAPSDLYISTAWQPGEKSFMSGTFMSADDAEELAIVLMYYAKLARGEI